MYKSRNRFQNICRLVKFAYVIQHPKNATLLQIFETFWQDPAILISLNENCTATTTNWSLAIPVTRKAHDSVFFRAG